MGRIPGGRGLLVLLVLIAMPTAVTGLAQSPDASATVSPWATGGVPGVAQPGTGKPLPYWQAPALPQAVVAGGTIPAGWTPQAVPYTGIGPDGRPITAYYAPTYTFTYQAGPPMLAHAVPGTAPVAPPNQVNRVQAWGYQPAPMTYAVPPATVARYQPAPYQFPAGSPQLAGTPIVPPPGPVPPAMVPVVTAPPAAPPMIAQQPLPPPPTQWGPAPQQMPPQLVPQPMAQPLPQQAAPPQPPPQWGPSAEPVPGLVPQQPAASPAADAFVAAPAAAAGAAFASANQQNQIPPIGSPAAAPSPVAPPRSGTHLWRVVGVNDGDTITCLDESNQQQKVRLASIDAPEIGQEYGKTARENLAAMVFGKTVEVTDEGKDRYGRTVGQVTCNGMDVNRQMIATGNAWHFAEYSNDTSLAGLQSQAQAQRLGLWATPNPTPPWDYRDTLKRSST